MPSLVQSKLINQLSQDFSGFHNTPLEAGSNIALAFNDYISTIQNSGGGSFISMSGFSTLRLNLGDIFSQQYPNGITVGNYIAVEFINCLNTLLTTYQTGPPVITYSAFNTQLQTIFSDYPNNGAIFAQNLGNEIHSLCSTMTISGTAPGPTPFTGTPI